MENCSIAEIVGREKYRHVEHAYAVLKDGERVEIPYIDELSEISGSNKTGNFLPMLFGIKNEKRGSIVTDISALQQILGLLRKSIDLAYESRLLGIELNGYNIEIEKKRALGVKEKQLAALENSIRIEVAEYDVPRKP
jgi:hypothetical protein